MPSISQTIFCGYLRACSVRLLHLSWTCLPVADISNRANIRREETPRLRQRSQFKPFATISDSLSGICQLRVISGQLEIVSKSHSRKVLQGSFVHFADHTCQFYCKMDWTTFMLKCRQARDHSSVALVSKSSVAGYLRSNQGAGEYSHVTCRLSPCELPPSHIF
jgi:hypothetical protein